MRTEGGMEKVSDKLSKIKWLSSCVKRTCRRKVKWFFLLQHNNHRGILGKTLKTVHWWNMRENRMKFWTVWLGGMVCRRCTFVAMWPIWVDLERWGWQVNLEGSLGALKMSPKMSTKTSELLPILPRYVRMGLCDIKAHPGPPPVGVMSCWPHKA